MIDLTNIQPQTKFKVLLIGDSCIDVYRVGSVNRLSPEAPVPVIKILEDTKVPGMAANVKLNLEALLIDIDFITNTEIIYKTRFIDKRSKQHLLRVDEEGVIKPWNELLPKPIENYNAIVVSDYNKGFLTYDNIKSLIYNSKDIPIFIDTKKTNLSEFSSDTVYIKINELEYSSANNLSQNLIVTLADKGAMLKTLSEEKFYPTKNVEVVDVCGCGDTFLSALTYAFLHTKDISKSIVFANLAASVTVQKTGNYAPSYEEIVNAGH